MEHDALLAALELLDEAIARDPNYAPALAMASFCQGEIRAMAWTDYSETARLRGLDLARRALRNGNDDARVLGFVAMATFTLGGDVVASDALIARALARNPGSSHAWGMSGWLNEYGGRHQIVLEHFNAALRLDPRSLYRPTTLHGMAAANFGLRHFEEAALLDREAMMLLPDYESPRLGLCATYAHLGQVADAKAVLGKMPLQTIKSWLNLFRDPVHREQLRSELALAGAHV